MSLPTNFRDVSVASLTGSDQNIAADANRQFLAISNPSSVDNAGVNLSGGTAAIGSAGTITLEPAGAIVLDHVVPQNAIHFIGTAGQALTIVVA